MSPKPDGVQIKAALQGKMAKTATSSMDSVTGGYTVHYNLLHLTKTDIFGPQDA